MATNSEKATSAAQPGTEVVMYKARLPWHSRFEDEFKELGVNKGSWRTLVEAIWPAAKSVEAVQMALSYCKARQLDPFKRPVHIVPVWSSALGAMVETVWPGISELRTTAVRTKAYAGMLATEFGPTIKKNFVNDKNTEIEIEFPEWARVTVRKTIGSFGIVDFPGPKVFWIETYATESRKSDWPNAMWKKRPTGQLEKCAEAAALRRAFPEEIGNEYTAEEMEGQTIHGGGLILEHEADDYRQGEGPPKGPPPVKGVEHKPEVAMDTVKPKEAEPIERERPQPEPEQLQAEELSPEQEREDPATKKAAATKKAKKAEPPPEEIDGKTPEGLYATLMTALGVALKDAQQREDEGPVDEWLSDTKIDRKSLPTPFSERMRNVIGAIYENKLGGPDIIQGL